VVALGVVVLRELAHDDAQMTLAEGENGRRTHYNDDPSRR
jgi:hypothetical protein